MINVAQTFKNIGFKEQSLYRQYLNDIDSTLQVRILEAARFLDEICSKRFIVTSLIRMDNPHSVHYYGLGCDGSIHHLLGVELAQLETHMNLKFTYRTPGKNTLFVHSLGYNRHIHLQA